MPHLFITFLVSIIASTDTIYFVIILLLIAYIVYLQFQISKNNEIYKKFFTKVFKNEKLETREEIRNLFNKLALIDFNRIINKDKLLNDDILNFIYEDDGKAMVFLHYTKEREVADKILVEGFRFCESFYKTAENVYKDNTDLINKHMRRKQFGKYAVVIEISLATYNKIVDEINLLKNSDALVEQILTIKEPETDENDDKIYTLPPQFIKGFINYEDGEIIKNKVFDYNYYTESFNHNLKKLRIHKYPS